MVLDAVGSLLPAAAGIALSPFPIVAVVLLLGTARGTANGIAFVIGWLAGLGTLTTVIVLVAAGADDASDDTSTAIAWLRIALGAGLLALATEKLLGTRPDGDEGDEGDEGDGDGSATPGWMAGLDDATPRRALGIGALLGGVNPKNLAFTLGAAPTISTIGLSSGRMVVTSLLYVVLASAMVLAMLLAHLVARSSSEVVLRGVGRFMLAHHAAITIVILALLGAKLLGDGLAGL